jgi:hypothetical protein
MFLMVGLRNKKTLVEAARFSGLHESQFSRFLSKHYDCAKKSLLALSKKQAKQFSAIMKNLADGNLPWSFAILIDSTFLNRSSLHGENIHRFNHGKGFIIGHRWTNIVLIINNIVIPMPPIEFYTKNYCKENNIEYVTENEAIIEYLKNLDLTEYIGKHDPQKIVVMGDSAYDDKRIENIIKEKKWSFVISLKKKRSVKSEHEFNSKPKLYDWCGIDIFFKKHRRLKWQTIRVKPNGVKTKRLEYRIRHTIGYLRYVGKVRLVCSEYKKRPDGRRKYLACNDLKATHRHIVIGYRIRWLIEIFHKKVKMFLGFEDVASHSFESVLTHVHLVYCAYILLDLNPPGIPRSDIPIGKKQKILLGLIESQEKVSILQLLSQFGGIDKFKNQLREALAENNE